MLVTLEERLHFVTAAEPEKQWKQMKTILKETTAEVVGKSTKKHQDWFDKAGKSCLKRNAPATIICLQNLMIKLSERTQWYADMGDMHAFYEALKAIYGPSHQIQAFYALRMEVPC